MNYYKQIALQHLGTVQPEANFFISFPNNSFTSSRTKQNRVYAYLLQKLAMLQKYQYLGDILIQLLKHLTGQFFYANYQGNTELRDFLIYYNMLVLQNQQVYKLFYNNDTSHQQKFKLWLRSLGHLNDSELQIEVEKYQFDTEYLNTIEYQILIAIINESDIDLSTINNGFVLLRVINYKDEQEKLEILKLKKNSYINDSYILKKEWLMLSVQLGAELEITELNYLSTVDNHDPNFQSIIISKYLELSQQNKAIEQIIEHLYLAEGNPRIWNILEALLTEEVMEKYEIDFTLLIIMHFGQPFLRYLIHLPHSQEQENLILSKLKVLSHFDEEKSEKYINFLQQQVQNS